MEDGIGPISGQKRVFHSTGKEILTLTKVSWLISPVSGANMDWTMNLCLFFSVGSNSKGCRLTAMLTSVLGSTTPELGLTQYL